MLYLNKISKSYNNKRILEDFSLKINLGETIGLSGPNGSGKTTLLKITSGHILQDSGHIIFNEVEIDKERSRIRYIDNNPRSFFLRLNSIQNLLYFSALNGIKKDEVKGYLQENKGYFDLNQFIHLPMNKISLGQIQIIGLLRAMITKPKILLFDEVFSSLDDNNRNSMMDLLNKYRYTERNLITIFCSHNKDVLSKTCDRLVNLEKKFYEETISDHK